MASTTAGIFQGNLLAHAAVQAWNQLGGECAELDSIQILKRHPKTAVYRLAGLSSAGSSSVIAKRCYTPTAKVEQVIYQQLLPRLGLPALRCYGFITEPAGGYSWLFLEDAMGLEYSSLNEDHRVLAGNWLGGLDGAAWGLGRLPGLPRRDCSYYLEQLRFVAAQVQSLMRNPVVPARDLPLLQTIMAQCELIESRWPELQQRCAGFPPTIVHGDFVSKNVRIGSTAGGPALLVFDWEVAGWGIPATDLAQSVGGTVSPNLEAYRKAMSKFGMQMDMRMLEGVAECGNFFRMLDIMGWACHWGMDHAYAYLSKPISCLGTYAPRLAQLLPSVGWAN